MLSIGLAVSLGGPLLFVLATKQFSLDSLSVPGRLVLWLLAAATLVIAAHGGGAWLERIGIEPFGWLDLASTIVAIITMLVGAIAVQVLVAKLGFKDDGGLRVRQKIYSLSVQRRIFVVVTAAATEEVLYRG